MKARKKPAAKAKKAPKKKMKALPKREGYHLRENVTEHELIRDLAPDLQDAWHKLRAHAVRLGFPRVYASHNSIMFSRKICGFFVRPKKSFLEVWIFLPRAVPGLKATKGSKTREKYSNLFKLVHADQVEEPLTDWIRESFEFTPAE